MNKHSDKLYFAFRVLIGLLFSIHGAQKLFGIFGGTKVELLGLIGAAGVIEFTVGIALVLGVLTRVASVFGGVTMLVAYLMMHAKNGWNPLVNSGELALLYLAAFLDFKFVLL